MEKGKKLQTKQRQFEILKDFMLQHSDLAKGQLQSGNAKQRANNLWIKLSDDLNSNGPPVRDIAGWKKVWADLKTHTKNKMRRNKVSISSTGGGVSQFCPLSPIEEEIINLLNMEEAVNGLHTSSCFGTSSNNTSPVTLATNKDLPEEVLESTKNDNTTAIEDVNAAKRRNLNENLHATKRTPLQTPNNRDNLLKSQVENQATFHKETTKVLGEMRNDLKDLVRYNRKMFELKQKELELSKEKFMFEKEYKLQKQKLQIQKLNIKKRILELELEKTNM